VAMCQQICVLLALSRQLCVVREHADVHAWKATTASRCSQRFLLQLFILKFFIEQTQKVSLFMMQDNNDVTSGTMRVVDLTEFICSRTAMSRVLGAI
jgi:hypothetical protein